LKSLNRRYLLGCVGIILLILVALVLLGPTIGNVFSNVAYDLLGYDDITLDSVRLPSHTPTDQPTATITGTPTATETRRPTATAEFSGQAEDDITPTRESMTDDESARMTATALAEIIVQPSDVVLTAGTGVIVTPEPQPPDMSSVQLTATALATLFASTPSDTPAPVTTEADITDLPDDSGQGTDVPFSAQDAPNVETIGNGSAFVFHDDQMAQDETMLVELQLFFDEFYITATPTSAVTAISAPELVRPAVDPQATMTPRAARFSEGDITLPEQLIAYLDCEERFTGCGTGGTLFLQIQEVNSWRWGITPAENVSGLQNLRVELWTVNENNERDRRIWTYDFTVTVEGNFLVDNSGAIIGGLVVVVLGLVSAFGISRWQSYRESHSNRPQIFISYRRKVSAGYGRTIHDVLTKAGADVFIDIDDIHAGSFSEYIKENIRERQYFIVLLAPGTLDSEWVQQEILYAHEHDRTIIPVLLNDFNLYGDDVPDNLTFLQEQNAVTLPTEHFDSAIQRIKTFIGLG